MSGSVDRAGSCARVREVETRNTVRQDFRPTQQSRGSDREGKGGFASLAAYGLTPEVNRCDFRFNEFTRIDNIELSCPIDSHILGIAEAAQHRGLRIASAGERLLQHSVVAAVRYIDVTGPIHRDTIRGAKAAANRALRVGASRGGLLVDGVVGGIRNVDVPTGIHRHEVRSV